MNERSDDKVSFQKLFSGSAVVIVIKVLGLASGFGIYFLLARLMDATEFGVYTQVLSIGVIGGILARLGLDAIIIRIMVEARTNGQSALARGMVRWSTAFTVFLCFPLAVAIYYYAQLEGQPEIMLAIPIMVGVALTNVATSILRGVDIGPWTSWPEFMGRPFFTLVAVAIAGYLLAIQVNAHFALSIQAVVAMALSVLILAQVLCSLPPDVAGAKPEYALLKWLMIALPVLWNNVILLCEPQLVVVLASWILSDAEVGRIALVARLAALAAIAEVGVNFLMPPILTRLYIKKDIPALARTMRFSGFIMVMPTIPALLIVYFFGEEILGIFGEDYRAAYWPLIVFTLSRAVVGVFGPVSIMLLMSGHERDVALSSTVSVAVMFGLAALLVPMYGSVGMALAVFLATFLRVLMNWRSVKQRLGFNSLILVKD